MIDNLVDLFKDSCNSLVIHWIGKIKLSIKEKAKDYSVDVYCKNVEEPEKNEIFNKSIDVSFLCGMKVGDFYNRNKEIGVPPKEKVETYLEITNPYYHDPKTLKNILPNEIQNQCNYLPENADDFLYAPCISLKKEDLTAELYQPNSENFIFPCSEIARFYFFSSNKLTRSIIYGDFSSLYIMHEMPSKENDFLPRIDFKQGLGCKDYKVLTRVALSDSYRLALNYISASLNYANSKFKFDKFFFRSKFPYTEPMKVKVEGFFLDPYNEYFMVTKILESTEPKPCDGVRGKYFSDHRSQKDTKLPVKVIRRKKPKLVPKNGGQPDDLTGDSPHNKLSDNFEQIVEDEGSNEFVNDNFEVVFPEKEGQMYRWKVIGKVVPTDGDKGSVSPESSEGEERIKTDLLRDSTVSDAVIKKFDYLFNLNKEIRASGWETKYLKFDRNKRKYIIVDNEITRNIIDRIENCYYAILEVNKLNSDKKVYIVDFINGDNHFVLSFHSIYSPALNSSDIREFVSLIVKENFGWSYIEEQKIKYIKFQKSQHREKIPMAKNAALLIGKMSSIINNIQSK